MKAATEAEIRLIAIAVSEEIHPGDNIPEKLLGALSRQRQSLRSGDILIIKHKIVSKAEGRLVDLATIKPSAGSIAWAKTHQLDARVIELALRESRAVIRRKNGVLITETRHGFLCANSGIDVRTSTAAATLCCSPKIPTAPLANSIANSRNGPASRFRSSSPTVSAAPGAKASPTTASASRA